MIGQRVVLKRGNRDEAERPFWISFADLMTALMVLFLVSLSVALVRAQDETAKARQAQEELARAKAELERREKERDTRMERRTSEVRAFLDEVEKIVRRHEGVVLDRERHIINFGSKAQFEFREHDLTLEQANALRLLVPELLSSIRLEIGNGRTWLKRIVVEGFTDDRGSYLYNLNLSLQRSQRVLCVLLAREWPISARPQLRPRVNRALSDSKPTPFEKIEPISEQDEQLIRSLFLVGGYSSNSQKASPEASRRIELRIEFFQIDEARTSPPPAQGPIGKCAI